jgi:hypothetical protein
MALLRPPTCSTTKTTKQRAVSILASLMESKLDEKPKP